MTGHRPHPTPHIVPAGGDATLAVVVRRWLGLSHRRAKAIIGSGAVLVDGVAIVDPAHRPVAGSVVSLQAAAVAGVAASRSRPIVGPGFRVVHLDRMLIVVDKQPGIVTVPTSDPRADERDPSLVGRVAAALQLAGHRARELYVVHRIDRETSGLVVMARDERSSEQLRVQFRSRTPEREYLAWTEGTPEPREGRLVHRLIDSSTSRRVELARSERAGKTAELVYRVEAAAPAGAARVRVWLVTGRRNQIRVQLAAIGSPIVGDRFYGAAHEGAGRAALHAVRLAFLHPARRERIEFTSPVPDDLVALDARLFSADRRLPPR